MISEVAIKTITSELAKELTKKGTTLFKGLADEIKQVFDDGFQSYLERHIDSIAYTKTIIHRSTPVYFYNIYFPLRLQYKQEKVDASSVNRVFWQGKKIVIIGDAGSGKSTLIKHLFLNTVHEKFGIPILIELRDLNTYSGSIVDFISNKLLKNKLAKNQIILERLLKSGNFIFFLDGYDELRSSSKINALQSLNEFITSYHLNRFLITSRPYTNIEYLPNFHSYSVAELEKKEINDFVRKQIKDTSRAENIISSISKSKESVIGSFITNPLLLTLFIITHRSNPDIPDKKYIFYRRVVDVLFKEHDSHSKIGFEREFRSNISQEKFESILKIFSFVTYLDSQYDFDKDYLNRRLDEVKYILSNDFSNDDFLSDLKISLGLWTEDGPVISFAHRSLQEYFAALFLSTNNENKSELYSQIRSTLSSALFSNEIENFVSLCEEMDEYNFNEYVVLPTLTKIQKIVQRKESKGKNLFEILSFFVTHAEVSSVGDDEEPAGYFHSTAGHSLQKYILCELEDRLVNYLMEFILLPKTVEYLNAYYGSNFNISAYRIAKMDKGLIKLLDDYMAECPILADVEIFLQEEIDKKLQANARNKQIKVDVLNMIKKKRS